MCVETLADRAIRKVKRDEVAGKLLGREYLRRHSELLSKLLVEVKDHYVTFPKEVREALEDFLK